MYDFAWNLQGFLPPPSHLRLIKKRAVFQGGKCCFPYLPLFSISKLSKCQLSLFQIYHKYGVNKWLDSLEVFKEKGISNYNWNYDTACSRSLVQISQYIHFMKLGKTSWTLCHLFIMTEEICTEWIRSKLIISKLIQPRKFALTFDSRSTFQLHWFGIGSYRG